MSVVFSWLDIVVFLVISLFGFRGYRRGLSGEILQVVGLFVSFLLAYQYFDVVGMAFYEHTRMAPMFAYILGYTIIFSLTYLIFYIIRLIVHYLVNISFISVLEKGGGLFFGATRGILFLSVLFFLTGLLHMPELTDKIVRSSFTGKYIMNVTPHIYDACFSLWEKGKRFDQSRYFMRVYSDIDKQNDK